MTSLKDKIPGGKADDKDIAEYDKDQLLKGLKIEMEHTDDPATALEITTDHLEENDKYYDHLEDMEKTMKAPSKELSKNAWARIAGQNIQEELPMKRAQEGYNGYTNYETWAVGLWFDNDRGLYETVQEMIQEAEGDFMTLADMMQAFVEEMQPELDGIFSDLLTNALQSVNWDELAKTAMEE